MKSIRGLENREKAMDAEIFIVYAREVSYYTATARVKITRHTCFFFLGENVRERARRYVLNHQVTRAIPLRSLIITFEK